MTNNLGFLNRCESWKDDNHVSKIESHYRGIFGALFCTSDGFVLVPQNLHPPNEGIGTTCIKFDEEKHYPALKISVKTEKVSSEIEISWLSKKDAHITSDSIEMFRSCEGKMFELTKIPTEPCILKIYSSTNSRFRPDVWQGTFQVSYAREKENPHSFQTWMSPKRGVTLQIGYKFSEICNAFESPPLKTDYYTEDKSSKKEEKKYTKLSSGTLINLESSDLPLLDYHSDGDDDAGEQLKFQAIPRSDAF